MGNQLTNNVKTVIRPIEYYLNEVTDLQLKHSLGQTQFFKVVLCSHHEGDLVVKVLPHEDPSLLLERFKHELSEFALITSANYSILPFRILEIRTNFAYIGRQYIRFSLYDRLSTRPFLADIEKCWLIYQIFKCMKWCHQNQICHGDIKLENILTTSCLWVLITDFALYKPTLLHDDNPLYFNYFFDTSRRRCCNIAPERFVSSNNMPLDHGDTQAAHKNRLTPEMDMFSIGCMLVEIFSDQVLFDLSELLFYKNKENCDRFLTSIEKNCNKTIQDIINNLISLDPTKRWSCEQILSSNRGELFPKYFDQLYELFPILLRLSPDAQIIYLSCKFTIITTMIKEENPNGILLIITLITTSIRSLKHVDCKLKAQRLLVRLVKSAPALISPYITDRIIPYVVHCFDDQDQRIRSESIDTLTQLLSQVNRVSPSDNNIFTDYLMEIIVKRISSEQSIMVRTSMARNVGQLSQIALNFLNQSCDRNYDEELLLLHKYFQNLISMLITDSCNDVRRTLLLSPNTSAQLCAFFGREKTNEVVLSHIITFLNDKNDFQLRLSFFSNIIVIASFLGIQCCSILYPLLQQGLCDAEETIIYVTIQSVSSLAEQGLVHKNILVELFREMAPLLYHPNQWIVNSIIHLITVLAKHLSSIDVNCKLLPILLPYLSQPVHCLHSRLLISELLVPPLPRLIYDILVNTKDSASLGSFFSIIQNQDKLKENAIYKRLLTENWRPNYEHQLLALSELIIKINRNKRNHLVVMPLNEWNSCIVFLNCDRIRAKQIFLGDTNGVGHIANIGINQEWQQMFGLSNTSKTSTVDNENNAVSIMVEKSSDTHLDCPPYMRDVRRMLYHKKVNSCLTKPLMVDYYNRSNGSFLPRGQLVTHIHEHKLSCNQLTRYGDTNCFISCSDDGTLRLWDVCNSHYLYVINRSRFKFRSDLDHSSANPFGFKGVICCGRYLITHSTDSLIHVFEIDESRIVFVCSFRVGPANTDIPLLVTSICALSDRLFAISTTDSYLYGYDIRHLQTYRFGVPIFKLSLPPSHRTVTSIDGTEIILFGATSSGYIGCFDLRFNLQVTHFNYEQNVRISKICFTPYGLFSATHHHPQIVLWNHKLAQRSKILTMCSKSENTTYAMLPIITDTTCSLITGGTDRRIRYWNVLNPDLNYIINDPIATNDKKTFPITNIVKQNNEIMEVCEIDTADAQNRYKSTANQLDSQTRLISHHDTITDLIRIDSFLISSGRNGTIKVWQ